VQSGDVVLPTVVLAAGPLDPTQPVYTDPYSIAKGIGSAKYSKDAQRTQALQANLTAGTDLVLTGDAGDSVFLTVDFQKPMHGYPVLAFSEQTSENVIIDLGYCEKAFDLYSGDAFVTEDGWLNPEGVVGKGYADRYLTAAGAQAVELPDERTARWMTLNVHFIEAGVISLSLVGVRSWMFTTAPAGFAPATIDTGDSVIDGIVQLSLTHALVSMSDT
jgi:hypothetical protein